MRTDPSSVGWDRLRTGVLLIAGLTVTAAVVFFMDEVLRELSEGPELLVTAEECLEAVRVVNEAGGWRPGESPGEAPTFGDEAPRRLPKLLPGINLVHGLQGERPETYEHNLEFLQRVLEEGLLLRRVNVRQVMAFPGTEMSETGAEVARAHKQRFQTYKRRIREEARRLPRRSAECAIPPGSVRGCRADREPGRCRRCCRP